MDREGLTTADLTPKEFRGLMPTEAQRKENPELLTALGAAPFDIKRLNALSSMPSEQMAITYPGEAMGRMSEPDDEGKSAWEGDYPIHARGELEPGVPIESWLAPLNASKYRGPESDPHMVLRSDNSNDDLSLLPSSLQAELTGESQEASVQIEDYSLLPNGWGESNEQ